MKHEDFVGQVQYRAQLSGLDPAERATRVVLETLAERLFGGEPENLAAQLPPEIGRHLRIPRAGIATSYTLDEFIQLVGFREGVDLPESEQHVRAVFSVLGEAVTAGEWEDVHAQLPSDFDPLFASSKRTIPRAD